MAEPRDAYAILGVAPEADLVEIRRSYQKLARRFHPDLRPGDPFADTKFRSVSQAYETLSDPESRRRYDEERRKQEGEVVAWSAERTSTTEVFRRDGSDATITRTVEKERVIRLQAPSAQGEGAGDRGDDLSAELPLEFAEAVRGTTKSFSVQREELCPLCSGEGGEEEACETCGGRGTVVSLERIRVRIPSAVDEGGRMRVPGKGNRGAAGGPPGDLYLHLRVRPHPYFQRQGLDVHADLPVTVAEAILGGEVEAPTVDGPVRVRLPRGTSGGRKLRLVGRGLTSASGEVGDHYCRVRVVSPQEIDEETESVLRRLHQPDPRAGLPKEPL